MDKEEAGSTVPTTTIATGEGTVSVGVQRSIGSVVEKTSSPKDEVAKTSQKAGGSLAGLGLGAYSSDEDD